MTRPSAKEIQAVAEVARVPVPLDVAERTFNSSAGGARSGNHKDRCRACADSVGRTPTIAASNVGNSRGAEAKIQRLTRFTRPINYLGLGCRFARGCIGTSEPSHPTWRVD